MQELYFTEFDEIEIEDLGIMEIDVYDIEVEDNHNFFGNDILVHNSGYFSFACLVDEIPYFNEMERMEQYTFFRDMMNNMSKKLLEPYYQIRFNKWSESFNSINKVHFKQEKIIHDQIVFAKKKYVCFVLDSEGKPINPTSIKDWSDYFAVTGLEIKRTDASKAVQAFAEEVLCKIVGIQKINGEISFVKESNADDINKDIISLKRHFRELPFEDMCMNKAVKNIEKYATDDALRKLLPKTPIQNKIAMQFNQVIKPALKIQSADFQSGSRLRYVYVKKAKNKWGIDCVAWNGSYPEQYHKAFEIDYDLIFQKSIMAIIERLYEAIGWGSPSIEENKLSFLKPRVAKK